MSTLPGVVRRLLLASLIGLSAAAGGAEPDHLKLYTATGTFEDVREDVALAIEKYGLVLERPLHIGEMLERTGKDLGTPKPIYAKAEALQFCSATISRRTMEANPTNIVFCPYTIVVYTLHFDPKRVFVGYRRPTPVGSAESQASLREVEALLDGIVRDALNRK
jgi:uncharacterized protein (DUF302 family)